VLRKCTTVRDALAQLYASVIPRILSCPVKSFSIRRWVPSLAAEPDATNPSLHGQSPSLAGRYGYSVQVPRGKFDVAMKTETIPRMSTIAYSLLGMVVRACESIAIAIAVLVTDP
jgi:hypothetical protein